MFSDRRRGRLAAACLVVVGLWSGATSGASAQTGEADQTPFVDRSETVSIIIPVTVRDRRGRLVPTLDQKLFHLYVDGIEFPIRSFWREGGLPLSLAVVVDTSGSMGGRRLRQARGAIAQFVKMLGKQDELCLITFGGLDVKRRLAFGADWSGLPALLDSLEGYGVTTLYDVLAAAPQIMDGAHNARRAILLFTDGVDTASKLSEAGAQAVLEKLADPLYVFGIEPPPDIDSSAPSYADVLRALATASGGRYLEVGDVAKLPAVAEQLRRELTMRYIISVEPSGVGAVQWRKVTVKVDGDFEVVTRRGYTGTLP